MELTNEEYVGILKDIQSIYHPDYIDFEYYSHREVFEEMLGIFKSCSQLPQFPRDTGKYDGDLIGIDQFFSKISQGIRYGPQ